MKKQVFRLALFAAFAWLSLPCAFAQKSGPQMPDESISITKAIPASPDAASLGKYGNIPVSPYTGVPNISIPLYTIKSGSISLPVSLSYHAGGNKVEEIASSVGLGWTLNAGGAITRTIRGLADEESLGFLDPVHAMPYITGKLNINNTDQQLNTYLNRIADGSMDGEADMYNFNFAGYSGRFVMDTYGNVTVIPQQKIKFTFNINTAGPYIQSFTAVTPDGVTYVFGSDGDGNDAVERTYSGNSCNPTTNKKYYATSWFIKRIIDVTGHQVNFSYSSENYVMHQAPGQTMYTFYSITDQSKSPTPMPFTTCTPSSIMNGVKLSNITFENGSVSISAATNRLDLPNSSAINSVSINGGGLYKTYNLYFTNTNNRRLRLDSLIGQLATEGGTPKEKYSFQYNDDFDLTSTTIPYQQDYWGYYNGNTANFFNGQGLLIPAALMTIPGTSTQVQLPGADRSSNEQAMLKGMLTSITYPTGGSTVFSYEANHESNVDLNGSSTAFPGVHNELAKCNDPDNGGYYNWDVNHNNAADVITIVSPSGNKMAVGIHGSGLQTDDPNTNDVTANLLMLDAQGNTIPASGAPIRNTDTTVYLNPGTYKLVLTDGKHKAYPTGTVKYLIDINWMTGNPALYQNYIVGGLRVKQIADYTGADTKPYNLRIYQYTLAGSTASSGFVDFLPKYEYLLGVNGGDPQVNGVYTTTFFTRSSVSNYPLSTTQGSVVGYSHVTELRGGSSQGGKTDYYYTNSLTNPDLGFGYDLPIAPPMSHDWERGLLLKQIAYRQVDATHYAKVQEQKNVYQATAQVFTNEIKTALNPRPSNYSPDFPYLYNQAIDGALTARPFTDYTNFYYLKSDTSINYSLGDTTKFEKTATNYQYDASTYQVNRIQTTNSKNENIIKNVLYPNNYTVSGTPTGALAGMKNLQNLGVWTYPIEETTQKSNADGSNLRTVSAVLSTYKAAQPLRDSVYQMQSIAGVSGFIASTVGTSTVKKDPSYKPVISFDSYDTFGNILQERKVGDSPLNYIWGYNNSVYPFNNTMPIAEVVNADNNSTAYTNFEGYNSSGYGNWTYSNTAQSSDATAPMGTACYAVTSSNTITKSGLQSAVSYIVSYWSKSGAAITVSGGTLTNSITGTAKSGWVYREAVVSGATAITIGGTGLIDELRLYPVNAQMSTYTYLSLVGMASKCDSRNNITYYVYDSTGRLLRILDQNRNILKDYQYNYLNTDAQWTDTGNKYCVQNGGGNTGEQMMEQRDTNPASPTYNSTRYRSLGATGSCPIPIPPLYVKLRVTGSSTGVVNGYMQTYNTFEADVFSDAACTVRYSVTTPLSVHYYVASVTTHGNGDPDTGNSNIYTIIVQAGSSFANIGSVDVSGCAPPGSGGGGGVETVVTGGSSTAAKSDSTTTSKTNGGATTNSLPGGGTGSDCTTTTVTVGPGTGYTPAN